MVVAVVALGFTQIISWGTTLYMPGVLGKPIAASTGWSETLVFGGLTLGLLVSSIVSRYVGRAVDQHGGRSVMSLGSVLVAIGLVGVGAAESSWTYLGAWAFLGFAMRLTLYDAAFAALVQVTPTRGRRAISYLTLFGGVASTIFWPIGYWLEQKYGWRTTLGIFAAINLFVCLPLHWYGLARRDVAPVSDSFDEGDLVDPSGYGRPLEGARRSMAMMLFGGVMAASAACFGAMAAHLVPVIAATGVGLGLAVTLASVKGIAQTLARLGDLVLGRSLHPLTLGRITLAILPLSFAVLLLGGANFGTALAFTVLFGITNGLTTIVRGAVPLALFGTKGYGEVLGILATPYLVLNALAPMVFAMVTDRFGIHAATVGVAVVGLVAWLSIELMSWWYRAPHRHMPEQN
jgi:hypothetical protein